MAIDTLLQIGLTAVLSACSGVVGTIRWYNGRKKDTSACIECQKGIDQRFTDGDGRMNNIEKKVDEVHETTSKIAENVAFMRGMMEARANERKL